jgi:hypothetical protein
MREDPTGEQDVALARREGAGGGEPGAGTPVDQRHPLAGG